jgi:hypothetical protein
MFNTNRLQSLYIPGKIIWNRKIRDQIKSLILNRSGDWGFKQPWITLCYPEFKSLLPKHIAIGIKRSFKGLKSHWKKRGKIVDEQKLYKVWELYNIKMEIYGIPILSFEDFIKNGPRKLEKIIGRKLKDVRENAGI